MRFRYPHVRAFCGAYLQRLGLADRDELRISHASTASHGVRRIQGNQVMQAKVKIETFVEPHVLTAIQEYRKRQVGEIPSKAQAIRELVELGISADLAEIASERV
jgi:3-methyladenine DNA glycosylase/8-oxoguanine DNA glycosylase